MAHRILLTDRQRSALFDLPTDEASLRKHYTLADDDLEHIRSLRPRSVCSRTDIEPDNDHADTPTTMSIDGLFFLSVDLELAAVSQVLGDPGAAEAVGVDLGGEARLSGATLDHLERTQARHRPILERIAPPGLAASEQKAAVVVFADAGGLEVGVDIGLGGVVGVVAPALLVEVEEPAGALGVVVGDAKRDRDAQPLSVIVDFRGGCSSTAHAEHDCTSQFTLPLTLGRGPTLP